MPQQSKILKLPREIIDEVQARYRAGGFELDELLAFIRERAPDSEVSRSGLYRHLTRYRQSFERIREAQQVAASSVQQLGENPGGDVGRLLAHLLSALALQSLNQLDATTEPLESKELMFLSQAIKNLATAEKTGVDRELKLRRELAAEVKSKTVQAGERVTELEKKGGLAPETAAALRAAIAEIAL